MVFNALPPVKRQRQRNKKPTVHIYSVEHRGGAAGAVRVRIRLSKPLLQELGWSERERVNVLVGHDADAGTLLINKSDTGNFLFNPSTQSRSSFVVVSRMIPLPVGIKVKADYEIHEGGLLVRYS